MEMIEALLDRVNLATLLLVKLIDFFFLITYRWEIIHRRWKEEIKPLNTGFECYNKRQGDQLNECTNEITTLSWLNNNYDT